MTAFFDIVVLRMFTACSQSRFKLQQRNPSKILDNGACHPTSCQVCDHWHLALHPSYCSNQIKSAYEHNRIVLSHRPESKIASQRDGSMVSSHINVFKQTIQSLQFCYSTILSSNWAFMASTSAEQYFKVSMKQHDAPLKKY